MLKQAIQHFKSAVRTWANKQLTKEINIRNSIERAMQMQKFDTPEYYEACRQYANIQERSHELVKLADWLKRVADIVRAHSGANLMNTVTAKGYQKLILVPATPRNPSVQFDSPADDVPYGMWINTRAGTEEAHIQHTIISRHNPAYAHLWENKPTKASQPTPPTGGRPAPNISAGISSRVEFFNKFGGGQD